MELIKVYKERALTSLKGNWGKGAVATLVYLLFFYVFPIVVDLGVAAAGLLPAAVDGLFSSVWQIAFLPLSWGFMVFFFGLSRNLMGINFSELPIIPTFAVWNMITCRCWRR